MSSTLSWMSSTLSWMSSTLRRMSNRMSSTLSRMRCTLSWMSSTLRRMSSRVSHISSRLLRDHSKERQIPVVAVVTGALLLVVAAAGHLRLDARHGVDAVNVDVLQHPEKPAGAVRLLDHAMGERTPPKSLKEIDDVFDELVQVLHQIGVLRQEGVRPLVLQAADPLRNETL